MNIHVAPRPVAAIAVHRPADLAELQRLLASTPAPHYYLAGGTDLLVQHKDQLIPDSTWLDITGLTELRGICMTETEICIGALTTHEDISRSEVLRTYAPALVAGCAVIGGPQIRWRGTIAGNLANASPAADTVPALYTLGATVDVLGIDGIRRTIAVHELASAPRRTQLRDGDLIVAVRFARREGMRGAFLRLGQRQSQAISKVSVALSAVLQGPNQPARPAVGYLSIACGSVAPTVLRVPLTEDLLLAEGFTEPAILRAVEQIRAEVRPIDDLRSNAAYRRHMVGVLLERAVRQVLGA
jgi:CO/xanthine dehydrogenase FAD-binding subunit